MIKTKEMVAHWAISLMATIILTLGLAACGGGGGGGGGGATVFATVSFGSSVAPPALSSGFVTRVSESCGNVDTDTIDSLFIDITRVEVHHAGSNDDDSDDGDEVDDSDSDPLDPDTEDVNASGWITVFEALAPEDIITVDVINLQILSEVLTSANLPVGKYTKVAIYYENPVLTIGGTEYSGANVQTTAKGRIFISQNFTIDDGGPVLIEIDFKTICLTDTVGGNYVINPQLVVDLSATTLEAEFEGVITAFTEEPLGFTVDNGSTILDVTVVITDPADPGDTEFVRETEVEDVYDTITFGDLLIGDEVEVEGELQLDGSIIADRVEVELEEVVI